MADTIVIGLDGLDSEMLEHMPSLSRLSIARLDSLIPLTYSSWPSILSGVNPGKHGAIDFFKLYKDNGRWRARIITPMDLDYPRIHEILELSQHKVKYALVNPLPSYPLTPLRVSKGFVASTEFFTPKIASTDDRILESAFDMDKLLDVFAKRQQQLGCKDLLDYVKQRVELYKQAIRWFSEHGYRLIWFNISLPDEFLHKCPKALTSNREILQELLVLLDGLVGSAIRYTENVMVVSDHGFRLFKGVVRINSLLYKHGYAYPARTRDSVFYISENMHGNDSSELKIGAGIARIGYKLAKGPLRPLVRRAYYTVARLLQAVTGRQVVLEIPSEIDSIRSRAFVPSGTSKTASRYSILLNDKNVASEIVKLLRDNGLEAYYAPDLLWGPHTPDYMVFAYGRVRHPVTGTIYDPPIDDTPMPQHGRYGILATNMDIPETREDGSLPGFVVAPLVLCSLKVPLDKYMDGFRYMPEECRRDTMSYRARWRIAKNLAAKARR